MGAADSMEFESILVSKALPDATFSQKAVIDTHRTITSSNDLRNLTAGIIRSPRGKVDACVYTRESVCREAATSNGHLGSREPRPPQSRGEKLLAGTSLLVSLQTMQVRSQALANSRLADLGDNVRGC